MKSIPDDASVATGGYVIPHLSSRREIVRLPFIQLQNDEGKIVDVDYALVDMWQLQQSKLAAGVDWRKIKASVPIIDQALEQEKYGIIDLQDGVMLLKKGVPSNSQAKSAWLKLREELRSIWQA
jgi:hypothetical protein